MEKIFFNTWPNLEKTLKIIQTEIFFLKFFIFLFIFLIVFFLVKIFSYYYKIIKIEKKHKKLLKEVKEYHKKRLTQLSGKKFLKSFINFVENLEVEGTYENLYDALKVIGITQEDIKEAEKIIYTDEGDVERLEQDFKEKLNNLG